MSYPLRTRIILLASVCLVVVTLGALVASFYAGGQRQRDAEDYAIALGKMIVQVPAAERARGGQPGELLRNLLPLLFAADNRLMFVVVTDHNNIVLARHLAPRSAGGPPPEDASLLTYSEYRPPSTNWKLVHVDVEDQQARSQFHLRLGYSLAGIRSAVSRTRLFAAFGILLAAAAAAAGAVVGARRLAQPLEELVAGLGPESFPDGDPPPPKPADEVAALRGAIDHLGGELSRRERLRSNFARFVSKAVADKVISENRTVRLGGEQREVTVMFCDIRGFTSYSATHTPEETVALLNECFRALADVVPRYGGAVDKFIGDGLMATFGAVAPLPGHEICAVMAGLEMQRVLADLNRRRLQAGQHELRLGIGINSGDAVAGLFGSERRLEYTVIGSTVNIAQRIEAHARNGEMLLGERTWIAVHHLLDAECLVDVHLKGLDENLRLYKVVQLKAISATAP